MQLPSLRASFDYLKSIFINGVLIILPISLTLGVFTFFFKLLKNWLAPLRSIEPTFFHKIPQSEILLILLTIFVVGFVFKLFFLTMVLHWIESIILKIPLMNPIYTGFKQLVQAFAVPDKLSFKKVVTVEFPRAGIYSIGFLTSEVPQEIAPKSTSKFYKIFIPTTPNPTTGFLIMAPEEDITVTDLSRQEAMSLIISGGIIQPERYLKR